MRHENFPSRRNKRFPRLAQSVIFALARIAQQMSTEFASTEADHGAEKVARKRPRAGDYFWRPRYAKIWWASAFAFWMLMAIDTFVVRFLPRPDEGWFFLILMLFHPYVIVPVLGFRFLRGWLEYSGFYDNDNEEPVEPLYDGGSGMGFHSAVDDPTNPNDPRFIMLPTNPASPAWRQRNLWGED